MRLADLKFARIEGYGHPVSQKMYSPTNKYTYRVLFTEENEGAEYSVISVDCPLGRDISEDMPKPGLDWMDVGMLTAAILIASFDPTESRTTGTTTPQ
jgi:hypothetical protein